MSGSGYTRSFNDILVSQIWSFWSGDKRLRPALLLLHCTLSACMYLSVAGHRLQRTVGQSAIVHVSCNNADIFEHLNDLGYLVSDFLGGVHLLPSIDFNIALTTVDIWRRESSILEDICIGIDDGFVRLHQGVFLYA